MNVPYTSNPSLIEIISAPAVAQSGIKMRRSDSSCKGLAVNCCSPVSTNKYRGMLRVVSKSTDMFTGRVDLFANACIYLCVSSRPREALLCKERLCCYPTRTKLQSSNCKAAGCRAIPQPRGWRPSPSKAAAEDAPGSTKPKRVITS